MQAFLWVHPAVLALIWGYEITICTRLPAGEMDRGTIDVLLSWPLSRRKIYCCETIVWLISGVLLIVLGYLGHRSTVSAMPVEMRPESGRSAIVMANLFCVYVAVGGIAFLVSALSDRRGRAVAVGFALVLTSFLVNFLAPFWWPAKKVAFLSVMQYYQPARLISSGEFPWQDATVLLTVAAASRGCWVAKCSPGGISVRCRPRPDGRPSSMLDETRATWKQLGLHGIPEHFPSTNRFPRPTAPGAYLAAVNRQGLES